MMNEKCNSKNKTKKVDKKAEKKVDIKVDDKRNNVDKDTKENKEVKEVKEKKEVKEVKEKKEKKNINSLEKLLEKITVDAVLDAMVKHGWLVANSIASYIIGVDTYENLPAEDKQIIFKRVNEIKMKTPELM